MENEDKRLEDIIWEALDLYNIEYGKEIEEVKTFEYEGMLTYNKGLVVTLDSGTEFLITIVKR